MLINNIVFLVMRPVLHQQKLEINFINEPLLSGRLTGKSSKSILYEDRKICHGSYISLEILVSVYKSIYL